MYACIHKTRRGFFEGCAATWIGHLLFATHPLRPAIGGGSMPASCRVILASANIHLLLQYLLIRNKPQGGNRLSSAPIGAGLCRIVDMDF
jgi:hypothetical protein